MPKYKVRVDMPAYEKEIEAETRAEAMEIAEKEYEIIFERVYRFCEDRNACPF